MRYEKKLWVFVMWSLCSAGALTAAAQSPGATGNAPTQKTAVLIDRIAAVVNDDVITVHELNTRIRMVEQQLEKQGTSLPAPEELKKQILERMIIEMLQIQFARETGVRVDDAQLDKTLHRISEENKFSSLTEFRAQLEKEGINYKKFREEIRNEIISVRLREREVDSKLVISEGEVDNYLSTQAMQSGKDEEYQLAHILVRVPEQADAAKIRPVSSVQNRRYPS